MLKSSLAAPLKDEGVKGQRRTIMQAADWVPGLTQGPFAAPKRTARSRQAD